MKESKEDDVKEEPLNDEEKSKEFKGSTEVKIDTEVKNDKPKEQSLDEGYQIFYKARDAYEIEDFDEAIKLYETIINKDALAKVKYEKDRFYFAKDINNKIDEGQRLYNEGKYLDAKIFMSKLMRGNYMMPNQEARAQKIYDNAEAKTTPEDESNAHKEFTYDKALTILK